MIIFSFGYQGESLFADLFLYYFTPFIGLSFYFFLNIYSIVKIEKLLIFFALILFVPETIYIIFEILDGFFGFDIHKFRLTKWYINNDPGRFEHLYAGGSNQNIQLYDLLPPALGLRGWPNYSAPLYTLSFAFILSLSYAKQKNQFYFQKYRLIILYIGMTCVCLIGVKTHVVTALISVILIASFVNWFIIGLSS